MINTSTSPLSEFAIYGLYGNRDIIIPFPYPRKILVSENGMGKTTVLNTLYAVLSGRFYRLENLEFREIVAKFPNGQISIRKDEIKQLLQQEDYSGEFRELQERVGKGELRKLVSLTGEHSLESLKEIKGIQHVAISSRIPLPQLAEKLKIIANDENSKFSPFIKKLQEYFDLEVLYLTTYRRIEENLQNLGYSPIDLQLPSGLIQFGNMDDVLERIEKIEGIAIEYQITKEHLLDKVTNICNSYLIDKRLIYTTSLEVRTKKGYSIPLDLLSSGEKQIISMFSHLYLSSPKECAILIDEPELSISIEWQRQLLPDILNAPRCQFLVAATHSPFIFENDLATNTVDLQEYIKEYP